MIEHFKTSTLAIFSSVIAAVIGLFAFAISWSLWEHWNGPMPGLQILLFPGNLSLKYIWHPLFTEEVNFWPKLALHTLGQFTIVVYVVAVLTSAVRRIPTICVKVFK